MGKTIIIVASLQPTKPMGFESQGMLLRADGAEVVLATFNKEAKVGVMVK